MLRIHDISARLRSALEGLASAARTRWTSVRILALGFRTAWVACASVLLGTLILVYTSQGQDLFLDVRGSKSIGTAFWFAFYAGVVLVWLVPVYVSARWILIQYPPAAGISEDRALSTWVEHTVPRLLVTTALAVLLLGQIIAVATAPYILDAANTLRNPKAEILLVLSVLFSMVLLATFRRYLFVRFKSFWDARAWRRNSLGLIAILAAAVAVVALAGQQKLSSAAPFTTAISSFVRAHVHVESVLVVAALLELGLMTVLGLLAGFVLTYVPVRIIRGFGIVLVLLISVFVLVPTTVFLGTLIFSDLATRLGALTTFEYGAPLGIGHLAILPPVTLLLIYVAWWGLGSPLQRAEGGAGSPPGFGQQASGFHTLSVAFAILVVLSIALVGVPLFVNPISITDHVYRALLLPFVLGVFVPALTFVSYWSFRWHLPIVLAAAATVAFILPDTDDVRRVEKSADRPTLAESVRQWKTANDCAGPQGQCPSPIIIAAAGGASRSAFLLGSVVGKLLDKHSGKSGEKLRPFERQTFAISGVSGGALGAVVTYAALADALTKKVTTKPELGAPPCVEGAHDTEWFAPHVKDAAQPSKRWRDCLQLILSGDFLSPVIVGLANDLLGLSPRGRDRAVVLENAWEQRYAHMTGQPASDPEQLSTLARPLIDVRSHAVEQNIWLPMLVLEGTSVSTGRRIVTSDVDTLLSTRLNNLRSRLFRDAYDLHELISTSFGINGAIFSPDGQKLLIWFADDDKAHILEAASGKTLHVLESGPVRGADWSPDGRHIVTHSMKAGTRLWLASSATEVTTFSGRDMKPTDAYFSSDGKRLITWGFGVSIWDVETGREEKNDVAPTGMPPVFSHDRRQILVQGNKGIAINDAVSGSTLSTVDGIWCCARFSLDDKRILARIETEGGLRALVYDIDSARMLIDTGYSNRLAAISPNGDRVIYAPRGGTMRIKESATGTEREVPASGGDDWVRASFSRNGQRILTWSRQGVRLLDAATGHELLRVRGQQELVRSAIMTGDGKRAFTRSERGLGRLWDLDTGEELYIVRSPVAASGCKSCDVRLSTAATMSARFPIISPHGNIRGRNRLVDRVVDGGYFENFGALTALELADALRGQFGLDPRIILVNNEPAVAGMSCLTRDSQLDFPKPQRKITFSTLRAPIDAMWATRTARGTHAAVDLCARIGGADKFAFITVQRDKADGGAALSMSWWLSKHAQQYLDAQVDPAATSSNAEAFRTIERWRRYPAEQRTGD